MLLIVGLWFAPLILPAAALVAVLMVGALAMHIKVRDPLSKSVPAAVMLVLSVSLCLMVAS